MHSKELIPDRLNKLCQAAAWASRWETLPGYLITQKTPKTLQIRHQSSTVARTLSRPDPSAVTGLVDASAGLVNDMQRINIDRAPKRVR